MTDQSIFGGNAADQAAGSNADNQTPAANPAADPNATLLASIVDNDGRPKYATIEEALKGAAHAQEYIGQLHTQVDESKAAITNLQQEVASRKSVQDAVNGIVDGSPMNNSPQGQEANQPVGLSAEQAEGIFKSMIAENKQQEVRDTNENAVRTAMLKKYGDKAEEQFINKANQLGLTIDQFNKLSGTSPKAVLEYFGTGSADTSIDVSQGSVNTEQVGHNREEPLASRNHGQSVLSGSTTQDVRQEYDRVKTMVTNLHEAGVTAADLTNPKEYRKHFGPKAN